MLVTYLVVVMGGYASTINTVQVQPSKEICEAAKTIHLELARRTPAFSSERDISKPILVECKTVEIPKPSMELKP
ncbi:hypothetical protein XaC1_248 [Xanthomonas phage XaC1]|nr:hypothetical protein XaC1_248 [Xanthomonas phage XaC1]